MGNQSYFIACPSRAAAEAFARRTRPWGDAWRLDSGKYVIPTLWLAAFGLDDRVEIAGADGSPEFTACIASAAVCVERLTRRRAAILAALGEDLGWLYDAWVRLVADNAGDTVLLHTQEMFWMMPFADADATLRRALAAYGDVDAGRAPMPGALDGFSGATNDQDALERPHLFVGWGRDWPPEPPRPPRWEDASIAEITARLADHVRDGVVQRWLDALPDPALDVLWAAGEHALVYALTRRRGGRGRAESLAWYAAIDPDSGRAQAAAHDALSLPLINLATLATVPLGDPALVRLARRAGRGAAERRILAMRIDGQAPDGRAMDSLWGEGWALVWAVAASLAAEQGRRADAEAALAQSFVGGQQSTAALLHAFRAFVRCGAWTDAIGLQHCDARVKAAAIAEGRRGGEEALTRLLERFPGPIDDVTAMALGRDVEATGGGPEAEARLVESYEEGLLSAWELVFRRACLRMSTRAASEAAIAEQLTDALAEVQVFAGEVIAACGPAVQDASALDEQRAALARGVASVSPGSKPTPRLRRSFREACRALADAGDAATVRAAVDRLESVWGPAAEWGGNPRYADWTIEIVASAAGRGGDAAGLVRARGADASDLCRACVAAGLARDGSLDAARSELARLVEHPPAPEAMPVLTALAGQLDPACAGALRGAAEQAAASLPGTREQVVAWLAQAR